MHFLKGSLYNMSKKSLSSSFAVLFSLICAQGCSNSSSSSETLDPNGFSDRDMPNNISFHCNNGCIGEVDGDGVILPAKSFDDLVIDTEGSSDKPDIQESIAPPPLTSSPEIAFDVEIETEGGEISTCTSDDEIRLVAKFALIIPPNTINSYLKTDNNKIYWSKIQLTRIVASDAFDASISSMTGDTLRTKLSNSAPNIVDQVNNTLKEHASVFDGQSLKVALYKTRGLQDCHPKTISRELTT